MYIFISNCIKIQQSKICNQSISVFAQTERKKISLNILSATWYFLLHPIRETKGWIEPETVENAGREPKRRSRSQGRKRHGNM